MKHAKMLTILVLGLMVWPAMVRGIGGSGTVNHIAKFKKPNFLGDSAIYEAYGRTGIGTTSPEKPYRLTVDGGGSFYGIYVRNTGDIGIESIGSNYGVRGSGKSRGVSGVSSGGFGVYGKTKSGFAGYFEGGRNYFGGKVGIGTTNPQKAYKLTVDGGGSFYGIYVRNTGDIGIESIGSNYGVRGIGNSRGVSGTSTNGIGVFGKSTNGYAAEFHGNVRIKTNDGTVTVMELGEGLDYAEGFDVSQNKEVGPGTVLIIDPDNTGKLALSNKPYDSKVAGIVAGARGKGSGVRLGAGQFDYDVALAGRVYCNVDATEIAVRPGDLLTTSATEGYAMKATDYIRAQGAILGKAMEKLEKGKKGQILVLVTLQ